MSRFLKGCYMDILIAQFNNGHLSIDEIRTVLGSDFGQSWPTLQKKFVQDENGLWFNEKLDREIDKRKKYSESRRKNREGKKTHPPTYDSHMLSHMENENENENRKVLGGVGERGKQPSDFYTNGAEMFDDVKEDPSLVEQLTRVVWNEGYRAVKETHVMLGVKKFCILEEAKGTFRTKPREEFRWHLVNWTRKNAKTISEYAANG